METRKDIINVFFNYDGRTRTLTPSKNELLKNLKRTFVKLKVDKCDESSGSSGSCENIRMYLFGKPLEGEVKDNMSLKDLGFSNNVTVYVACGLLGGIGIQKGTYSPTKFWTLSFIFGAICMIFFNSNYEVMIDFVINKAQEWNGAPFTKRAYKLVVDSDARLGVKIMRYIVKYIVYATSRITWQDFGFKHIIPKKLEIWGAKHDDQQPDAPSTVPSTVPSTTPSVAPSVAPSTAPSAPPREARDVGVSNTPSAPPRGAGNGSNIEMQVASAAGLPVNSSTPPALSNQTGGANVQKGGDGGGAMGYKIEHTETGENYLKKLRDKFGDHHVDNNLLEIKVDPRSVTIIETLLVAAWLIYYLVFILGTSLLTYFNVQHGVHVEDIVKFAGLLIGVPIMVVLGFLAVASVMEMVLQTKLTVMTVVVIICVYTGLMVFNVLMSDMLIAEVVNEEVANISNKTVGGWLIGIGIAFIMGLVGFVAYERANQYEFTTLKKRFMILMGVLAGLFIIAGIIFMKSAKAAKVTKYEVLTIASSANKLLVIVLTTILLSYAGYKVTSEDGSAPYNVFNVMPFVMVIALISGGIWTADFISKTVFGVESVMEDGIDRTESLMKQYEHGTGDKTIEDGKTESVSDKMSEEDARVLQMYGSKDIGKTALFMTITYMFFFLLINKKPRLFDSPFIYRYLIMGGILVLCYFLSFSTLFYHVGTFHCGNKFEISKVGIEGLHGHKIKSVDDYYEYLTDVVLPKGVPLDPQTNVTDKHPEGIKC